MTTMHNSDPGSRQQLRAEVAAIEAAMREAVHEAVLLHKRLGLPMVTWEDGKVVWVPADQLPTDDAPSH